MPVTAVPFAAVEVVAQSAQTAVDSRSWQAMPDRGGATYIRIEVCLGSAPQGDAEAVGAVGRDGYRFDPEIGKDGFEVCERGERLTVVFDDLWQVIAAQPQLLGHVEVQREQDDPPARDAEHFGETPIDVIPVVHRKDAYRRVHALVYQRQRLGDSLDRRGGIGRALGDHHGGGLDCDDLTVSGLIGAGARSDVEDALRVPEGFPDCCLKAGVGAAYFAVADAHAVVGRRTHRFCPLGLPSGGAGWASSDSDTSSSTKSP